MSNIDIICIFYLMVRADFNYKILFYLNLSNNTN